VELAGALDLDAASNPAGTAALTNRLTPLAIPKAFCQVYTDGGGGITVDGAMNVSAVSLPGANKIRVTFAAPMGSAVYVPLIGCSVNVVSKPASAPPGRMTLNANYLEFEIWGDGGGSLDAAVDPAGVFVLAHIAIFGAQ
jgi:hypothetical protein